MDDNTSFPTSGQTNSPQPVSSAGGVPPVAPVVPSAPQPVPSQYVPNQSFTPPPSTQVQMPPQEVVMSQSQSSVPLQTTLSPGASIQMPPEQSPVIEQPVPVASPQQVFQQVPQAPVGPSSDMPQPMPAASVPSEAVSASLPEEKHIPDLTAASQILQTSSIGRERVSLTPPVSPPQQIPS
ncbi:MAG TPA: hypothetical protein VFQ63_00770, partial [Patescibacteria group bacterium]|nr:hypothetical protein [Patescibacteria group bacterium]